MFVSPRFFHFPITLDRIDMGVGVGMCPCPKFLLVKQGKYTHLLYFFCRWLSLISMTSVTHCQITVLYRLFIPFCTCYTCNLYYFFYFFQCSIQRLSTFKDRFIYLGISLNIYIESAKRNCAIIQSRQVFFIWWIYIFLKQLNAIKGVIEYFVRYWGYIILSIFDFGYNLWPFFRR